MNVFDDCRFSHVNSELANVGHVIADALEVLGNEKETGIARCGRRVGDHHLDKIVEYLIVKIVYLGVAFDYLAGCRRIVCREGIERRSQH